MACKQGYSGYVGTLLWGLTKTRLQINLLHASKSILVAVIYVVTSHPIALGPPGIAVNREIVTLSCVHIVPIYYLMVHSGIQWILSYLNLFDSNAQFIWNKQAGYVIFAWFTMHVHFKCALTAVKIAASTCRKQKRGVLLLENKLSTLDRIAKGKRVTKVASELAILWWLI